MYVYYSIASCVKRGISREEAEGLYRSSIKRSEDNSAYYCGMRKHHDTTAYVLCNSAVVLNKSGKTGSACEESWVSHASIMQSKVTLRRTGNSALSSYNQ